MSTAHKRIVVMISGRGSNMAALIAAAKEADYPAEIVGVISDQADATGLKAAESFRIATRVVSRRDHASKDAHDGAIDAALRKFGADIVCLAGYMRLLTPGFVDKWQGRMINIHPSLLPMFKGLNTHRRALDAGAGGRRDPAGRRRTHRRVGSQLGRLWLRNRRSGRRSAP